MLKEKATLNNELGLHARPASVLVKTAERFSAKVKLSKGDKEANLKSILGVLWLKIKDKEEIIVKADGPDEKQALDTIIDLIENRLRIVSYDQSQEPNSEDVGYVNPAELITMLGQGVKKNLQDINM